MSMMYYPPGEIYAVKLVREDIDLNAPLQAKSENDAIATVYDPLGKFQGLKEQIIQIHSVAPGDTKIQILFDGNPKYVIAELILRVVSMAGGAPLLIRPYLVTIADAAGNNPAGPVARNYNNLINEVNDIWRPHGIQFRLLASRQKSLNLVISGTLRATADYKDFRDAIKSNDTGGNPPDPNAINVLFVKEIEDAWGLTITPPVGIGTRQADDVYGIAMRKPNTLKPWTDACTLAHELGHYLDLDHTDGYDDTPASYSTKGGYRDIWILRSLMTNKWPKTPPSWHEELGYGKGMWGALITIRELKKWYKDGEQKTARNRADTGRVY